MPHRLHGEAGNARGASLFLSAGDFTRARWAILLALREPQYRDDHRVWARLALTWVEDRRPELALCALETALAMAPHCPLLLWYRASVLELLGRNREAIATYRWLAERGVTALSRGPCGVGRRASTGLLSDCYQRLSVLLENGGERAEASSWHARHLEALARGHRGLFTLDDTFALDDLQRLHAVRIWRDGQLEH